MVAGLRNRPSIAASIGAVRIFDLVDWGGRNTARTNEWVSFDALAVIATTG